VYCHFRRHDGTSYLISTNFLLTVSAFHEIMEQSKKHPSLIDYDNFPEAIPSVLPEVYQEAPEVYNEAPALYRDSDLPERVPDIYSTYPPTNRPQWWKRHRTRALVCIAIISIIIIGGVVGGSIAATTHKKYVRDLVNLYFSCQHQLTSLGLQL
jgi:hypothetical protein